MIFLWLSRRSSELEIRMLRFNPRLGIIFSLVTKRMTYFPIPCPIYKVDVYHSGFSLVFAFKFVFNVIRDYQFAIS